MAGLLRLVKARLNPPSDPTASFHGKTILLTGGTSGLGFEAAVKFVSLGASTVIIGARNSDKGKRAKEAIEQRTSRQDVVQVWQLDMDNFKSVDEFADRVNREVERLDIAELNAGVTMKRYEKSPTGWEQTIQLRASKTDSGPAHLAITSSGLHASIKPEWISDDGNLLENLNAADTFLGDRQYNVTKLFVEYAVKELASLTTDANGQPQVIVNSLCPGFCSSDLARQYDSWLEIMLKPIFFGLFALSAEQGSRTLVSGTTQGAEAHGRFWKTDTYPETGEFRDGAKGKVLQKKAWQEMIDVLSAEVPEIRELAMIETFVKA